VCLITANNEEKKERAIDGKNQRTKSPTAVPGPTRMHAPQKKQPTMLGQFDLELKKPPITLHEFARNAKEEDFKGKGR